MPISLSFKVVSYKETDFVILQFFYTEILSLLNLFHVVFLRATTRKMLQRIGLLYMYSTARAQVTAYAVPFICIHCLVFSRKIVRSEAPLRVIFFEQAIAVAQASAAAVAGLSGARVLEV